MNPYVLNPWRAFLGLSPVWKLVAALFLLMCLTGLWGWYHTASYNRDRAEFERQREEFRLRDAERASERDQLIGRALEAERQLPPLLKANEELRSSLAEFGARGRAAVAEQEEAKRTYEAELAEIARTSDNCALCRRLCAERANDPNPRYRCASDKCDVFCASR
jgi:hypothetical protein